VTPDECKELSITTQDTHAQGVTDILIRGSSKYVVIEVKVESKPGWDQLDRYNSLLAQRSEEFKLLVLLSRYSVDQTEAEKAGAHVRWDQLARTLNQNKKRPMQATTSFLVDQFLGFLKEEGMAVDKVSWELTRGVESLMRLMNEIDEGIVT
jgi:PD-(D/E)XK nuclease superfamily